MEVHVDSDLQKMDAKRDLLQGEKSKLERHKIRSYCMKSPNMHETLEKSG